jgi:hypothetical integral membrane protein (TIGR02206 family)
MWSEFRLFGAIHVVLLAAMPGIAWLLAGWARRRPGSAHNIRLGLAFILLGMESAWYVYNFYRGWFRFPGNVPLEFCGVLVWITVAAAFTLRPALLEYAYYGGVGGASSAVLTPELWAPLWSYITIHFLLVHVVMVIIPLYLVWSGIARPGPGSMWRAFLAFNVYALGVGVFNAKFGTNYMFLMGHPEGSTVLHLFGPWPYYLLVAEVVVLAVFWLLYLPFRPGRSSGAHSTARQVTAG